MPIYSFAFVVLVASAIFFYRAAEFDDGPGPLWAALSVAISLLIWQWLGWGLLAMILGQVGLFVCITLIRMLSKS